MHAGPHEGNFTIYNRYWKFKSNCSVGAFRPTNLTSFKMSSSSFSAAAAAEDGKQPWLEIGVSGATETVPNPGAK